MDIVERENDTKIKTKIHTIRGVQVMLDRDLAELYGVETKVLNQAVKRNIERFPKNFMFQLNLNEFLNWKSQFVTSNSDKMGLRKNPYAFTEKGVFMTANVLKSDRAVNISVVIVEAFVEMRHYLLEKKEMPLKIRIIEKKLIEHDENFDKIFNYMSLNQPKQGIFYQGEIFQSYEFINNLLLKAKSKVIIVDNYLDFSVLVLLKGLNVDVKIVTKKVDEKFELDVKKFKEEYKKSFEVVICNEFHDRFLVIDDDIYHIGGSIKV